VETRPFSGAAGARLTLRSWGGGTPRAAVLISHGLGEHGGRYAALAGALVGRGIAAFALDHRGHGLSGGARGHVDAFPLLVEDLERARADAFATLPPETPAFLLGHSLGGLIAIHHLLAHPGAEWRGVVLSAPLLRAAVAVPRWKEAISPLLSRLGPALPFGNEIRLEDLSSAPGYAAAYRADPLLHRRITPRMYTEMRRAMAEARTAGELAPPLLVLAPGADRVVAPAAVLEWAEHHHADLRTYPGFLHEPINDAGGARVIADVLAWIEERLTGRPATLAETGGTSLAP
jgi:alpha-beta hydrolase superfamily lysophospholipase